MHATGDTELPSFTLSKLQRLFPSQMEQLDNAHKAKIRDKIALVRYLIVINALPFLIPS